MINITQGLYSGLFLLSKFCGYLFLTQKWTQPDVLLHLNLSIGLVDS